MGNAVMSLFTHRYKARSTERTMDNPRGIMQNNPNLHISAVGKCYCSRHASRERHSTRLSIV